MIDHQSEEAPHTLPLKQALKMSKERSRQNQHQDQESQRHKKMNCCEDVPLDKGAYLPSYIAFVKFIIVILGILCLTFVLPMCLIIRTNGDWSQEFSIISLSVFSIISSSAINLLAYISFPVLILQLILLVLFSWKLKSIQASIDQTKAYPTSYALLLHTPYYQPSEEGICKQIQKWFKKQLKFNSSFSSIFPELCSVQNQQNESEMSSSESQSESHKQKKPHSKIIEKIVLSYNFDQYMKISQEVKAIDKYLKDGKAEVKPQEIPELIQLYNKKKNILSFTAVTSYSLAIFKNPRYAQYFYQRTIGSVLSNFFCVECYSDFEIEKNQVEVLGGLLPNQINWKNMHIDSATIIKKRILHLSVWILLAMIGIIFQWGSIYIRWNNTINHSNQVLFNSVSGLMINCIVIGSNKWLVFTHQNQTFIHSPQQKKALVGLICLLNLICFTFAPITISYIISPALLYDSGGFAASQLSILAIYMVAGIIDLLLSAICCDQEREPDDIREFQSTSSPLGYYLTVLCIAFCLSPIYPLVAPLALLWFLAIYLLQKIIISRLHGHDQHHGSKLILSLLPFVRKAIICFALSVIFVFWMAFSQFHYVWSVPVIILISTSLGIVLLLQMIGLSVFTHLRNCFGFQKNSKLSGDLLQRTYYSQRQNFIMQYQEYNFALCDIQKDINNHSYSARIKIYDQLNTMSKTLSLSLKQRLFANAKPLFNNQKRLQRMDTEDVNDIYFQYERKVTMKKTTPKVSIPPLFKKEEDVQVEKGEESRDVELMNFNSIFSSDDKEAKQKLRRHINRKLQDNAVRK